MYQLSKQLKETKTSKVLLSLGSNKGDSFRNISESVDLLIKSEIICKAQVSLYYKTSPVGYEEQNDFLNSALIGETGYSPQQLLFLLKSVEYLIGRKKRERWHEREIDIDILLFGNEIINLKSLKIPHIEFHNRKFALLPANEIAPDFFHPVLKKNINQLLREYNGNEKVIKIK